MRKMLIASVDCSVLSGVSAARNSGGESGPAEGKVPRNAFIEVTPPQGRRVRWISEDDFILTGPHRADAGAERVTIRARPGWKLTEPKDGVVELVPGKMMAYAVAGELGEDGEDGNGHECDNTTTVVTNHISAPIIILTNVFTKVGGILIPQAGVTSTAVSFGAEVLVVSNGNHEIITTVTPCTICGEPTASVTTNNVTITPTEFHWAWWYQPMDFGFDVGGASFEKEVTRCTPGKDSVIMAATVTNLPSLL